MKILVVDISFHHKNRNALLKYNHQIDCITDIDSISGSGSSGGGSIDLSKYDLVYSPTIPIDVKKYPKTRFLFGPHFSVFPDNKINLIKGSNSIYIQPSSWVVNSWKKKEICNGLNIKPLPFGVDTELFTDVKPITERESVFIYFKNRSPNDLRLIENFLEKENIKYKVFSYKERYNSDCYLKYLQESKFGIWVGCHESQGFALEEALSCNVPLLVWNVTSMNQEYGCNYPNIPATSIPYWDNSCGEFFTNISDLRNIYNKFKNNINNYNPRKYILENLSIDKCNEKFNMILN